MKVQFISGKLTVNRCVLFLIFFICFSSIGISQKVSFFQKARVYINSSANKDYKVIFLDSKTDTLEKWGSETFDPADNLISYQKTIKPKWIKAKPMDNTATLPTAIANEDFLYADIKPDEGRLLIYFWPLDEEVANATDKAANKEVNDFYEKHAFSITLPDRINLAFRSSAFHAGPLTLPMKIYLGGPDSISSVSAAVNVGFYIGFRYGHTKFVKMPDEKEVTTYQTSHSWNLVLGINKLDLDDKNTIDDGKVFKGSIASLSTGIAYGLHIKNFTVLAAFGIDHPLGKRGKLWSLKGRPWFGFGAGFDIF